MSKTATKTSKKSKNAIDWKAIALNMLISRAMDDLEETQLVPEKKVQKSPKFRASANSGYSSAAKNLI